MSKIMRRDENLRSVTTFVAARDGEARQHDIYRRKRHTVFEKQQRETQV